MYGPYGSYEMFGTPFHATLLTPALTVPDCEDVHGCMLLRSLVTKSSQYFRQLAPMSLPLQQYQPLLAFSSSPTGPSPPGSTSVHVHMVIGDVGEAFVAMGYPRPPVSPLPPGFTPPIGVTLSLTPQESAIFTVLREVGQGTGTEVRVAGGWVRDKLVGRPSHDIDVCVDNMSGAEFAGHVNAYLAAKGEVTSSVGVIQANPEQSKHLETATVKVLEAWVDFVGLRAEVYDGESRIPRVVVGTPLQDAMRRDFTVNSLFFNISRQCVEDLTGMGVADLGTNALRTPLPPLITLRDDPLRVLRAVRFSSRFGLNMVHDLEFAAKDAGVAGDLVAKVSRERVGIEVENMVGGAAPATALRTLAALGLSPAVFAPPHLGDILLGGRVTLPSLPNTGSSSAAAAAVTTAYHPPPALLPFTLPGSLTGCTGMGSIPPQWLEVGIQSVGALEYVAQYLGPHGLATLLCCSVKGGGGGMEEEGEGEGEVEGGGGKVSGSGSGSGGGGPPLEPPPPFPHTFPSTQPTCASALDSVMSLEERRLLFFAAQLYPLTHAVRVKGARSDALPCLLMLEGLKRKKKDGEDVGGIQRGASAILELLESEGGKGVLSEPPTPPPHTHPRTAAVVSSLGVTLRKECKELWRPSLLLALALTLQPLLYSQTGAGAGAVAASQGAWAASIVSHIRTFQGIAARVTGVWGLDGCWAWKPMLDGRELKAEVDGKIAGPAMGALMEAQMAWMVLNPHGTRVECIAYLKGLGGK